MNRRSFLRILAGAAPVAAIAPTYFFAPLGGWKPVISRFDMAQWMADRNIRIETANITIYGIVWSVPLGDPEVFYDGPIYGGIERASVKPAQQRLNESIELMDDFARRCGAKWTDKAWT